MKRDAPYSCDVIIVGAGAAGLVAGMELLKQGLRIVIIEARDRVGGRIHTLHSTGWPIPVELGAEFVHGRAWQRCPGLWPRRARTLLRNADGPHYERTRQKLSRVDKSFEQASGLFLRAVGFPLSVDAFLKQEPSSGAVKRLARSFASGFYAATPSRASADFIGQMAAAADEIHGDELRRFPAGYHQLIERMMRSVPELAVHLRLSTEVATVRWRPGHVAVDTRSPWAKRLPTLTAHRLLCTVPVSVLAGEHIRFVPRPKNVAAAQAMKMGPVVKALLKFRPSAWRSTIESALPKFGFLHGPQLDFPTWWRPLPSREPVLVGWSGGSDTKALVGKSERLLLHRALRSLSFLVKASEAELAEGLDACRLVDWSADPLALGAYCVVPVGAEQAQRQLGVTEANTLFFAGEATHTEGHAGTVHGAMETGLRAAREIFKSLAP